MEEFNVPQKLQRSRVASDEPNVATQQAPWPLSLPLKTLRKRFVAKLEPWTRVGGGELPKPRHIQGAALVTDPPKAGTPVKAAPPPPASHAKSGGPGRGSARAATRNADGDGPFDHSVRCKWYRTCEVPIATALEAAPDLLLPTPDTRYVQEMTSKTGEAVMKAVWNSPLCTLYEAWDGGAGEEDDAAVKPPPVGEAILTDFRCPRPDEVAWPTAPGPGYVFGCNSQTMDECLGRGLFGLPAHMMITAAGIRPGSSIFLYNVTEKLIFGIFEALTTAQMNLEPKAFSKVKKSISSPFPVQIFVRVSLECPPIHDDDPVLNDILRARVGGRIGPLTFAQTEALASLIANQCGALKYMNDYRKGVQTGAMNVPAPPIALPPRMIGG